MRKIKLLNTKNEPKCRLQKVANFQTSAAPISGYFASYEENVFPAAREAILKGGKFYDMFAAGDGPYRKQMIIAEHGDEIRHIINTSKNLRVASARIQKQFEIGYIKAQQIIYHMNFTHLHVHSRYSILDGMATVHDIVDKCIASGMNAVALTDHGNMYGIKELLDYCKLINEDRRQTSVKPFIPIVGVEAYCARRGRHSMSQEEEVTPEGRTRVLDRGGWHLILLAKNKTGYQNLCRLVSESNKADSFFVVPRIDHELLQQYHEGLICCSGCIGGELPQKVLAGLTSGDMSEARKTLEWFKNLFGADYYIELQRHRTLRHRANRHTYELQSAINPVLIDLAHEYGVKLICSNDSHFVNAEEADAHDCLLCMNTDKCIDEKDRHRYSKQEWIKTPEEMAEIFSDIPEALANTQEIVDKVELYDIDHAPILPKLELPIAPEDYLRQQVMQGGLERYGENFVHSPIFTLRAETELKALCANRDAVTYLLIIADMVNVAREMGIIVGPGRSSAAGSLVNYCLKITDVDPLENGLLFERFYSGADELPKIDIDVEKGGREKLNAYLAQKYGIANVARVLDFERMRDRRMFVPKLAHIMRIPDSRFKELDMEFDLSLEVRHGGISHALRKAMRERQSLSASELNMFKNVRLLQDVICRATSYPDALALCGDELPKVLPLSSCQCSKSNRCVVTGYDGNQVESVGLIKFDIVELYTLQLLKECLKNIKQVHGIDLDINNIPKDDDLTFELFRDGKTIGIPQFESEGMRRYLRELHPNSFEELDALNGMYRPGSMEYISHYIARKQGSEPIGYGIPVMDECLEETYGIIAYQEQVMLLCQRLANFTPTESNILRKAFSHNRISVIQDELKNKFMSGGIKNGYKEDELSKVWELITTGYCYICHKAHEACYTWSAYQMAYLKAHYYDEFVSAHRSVWDNDNYFEKRIKEEQDGSETN